MCLLFKRHQNKKMEKTNIEITLKKLLVAERNDDADLRAEATEELVVFKDDPKADVFMAKLCEEVLSAREKGRNAEEELLESWMREIEANRER